MKNSLGNLIELLYQLSQQYGDEIPVSINLYHDRVLALKSVCFDDTDDSCPQILFEADLEDRSEQDKSFNFYSQREIAETLIGNKVDTVTPDSFLDDLDKMYDLLTITKEEFLQSYLYMSEAEYDLTMAQIMPVGESVEDNEEQVINMANLLRRAENLYIEEINERPTEWNILGSQLKEAIYDFVRANYSKKQNDFFDGYCDDLAI